MKPVFIDSGFLIALETADDRHHKAASQCWRVVMKSLPSLVTTSYVFDEITTFFSNRNRPDKAAELGRILLESAAIELIHLDEELFRAAWQYFQKHDDKTYSFTDCVSFVVMKQRGIKEALTFDKHFKQAGFERLP